MHAGSSFDLRHERMRGHGVHLHVVRAGSGHPVLLLHGFPECWYSWRHQIPALAAAGFSVLAPDLRGYNLSDKPAGLKAYDLRWLVEDAAALIRATAPGRAHVVGHDWGGMIAWCLAGSQPELVDRLVILNAPHLKLYENVRWRSSQALRSWYVLMFQPGRLPEAILRARDFSAVRHLFRASPFRKEAFSEADIERYVEAIARPGALTATINYYRALRFRQARAFGRAARVQAETLVLWGDKDPALSVKLLDNLEEVAPAARIQRWPDVGHWIQNEAPLEVNSVLIDFLTSTTK